MLKAKLDRLERKGAFLARQELSCAAQAEGRREDKERQAATTTTPFALLTGDVSLLVVEPPTPPRLLDTTSALQRWLDEAVLDEAGRAGQSGGGERAAVAAAWAYERAAAVRAAQAAGSGGERSETHLGGEVPAEGGRRPASISSEMSGRVEEHRNALAAGPKTSRPPTPVAGSRSPRCAVAAAPPPAPAKYPSIVATWHCPAPPEVPAPRAAEPLLGYSGAAPLRRVGTWSCLVQDVHSLLGCQPGVRALAQ